MKLKLYLRNAALCLSIAVPSIASATHPGACPSVEAIKAEGLSLTQNFMLDLYAAYHFSQYDTEKNWLFGIGLIEAANEEKALAEGNQLLNSLSGRASPEEVEKDQWLCMYDLAGTKYTAIAYQTDFFTTPLKLKSYFRQK